MSKNHSVLLSDRQIYDVKKLVADTRQFFGVHPNVPIGSDIRLLLDKNDILLCEYPFPDTNGAHTYGNITWFQTDHDTITFIGLNTSSFYDEQIFAIAHELYHYITKSGKAYTPELDDEDAVTEKQADRFAAELLLPADALKDAVMDVFHVSTMTDISDSKTLRFVARMQCIWWLPFQAIINRLLEEHFINKKQYDSLYEIDCRSEDGGYRKLLKSIDPEISDLLNKKTRTTGVSNQILETIISNYEDGFIDDDEFFHTLAMFDKKPEDFGFCLDAKLDEEMMFFFEREDTE